MDGGLCSSVLYVRFSTIYCTGLSAQEAAWELPPSAREVSSSPVDMPASSALVPLQDSSASWTEVFDEATNSTYYFNTSTQVRMMYGYHPGRTSSTTNINIYLYYVRSSRYYQELFIISLLSLAPTHLNNINTLNDDNVLKASRQRQVHGRPRITLDLELPLCVLLRYTA